MRNIDIMALAFIPVITFIVYRIYLYSKTEAKYLVKTVILGPENNQWFETKIGNKGEIVNKMYKGELYKGTINQAWIKKIGLFDRINKIKGEYLLIFNEYIEDKKKAKEINPIVNAVEPENNAETLTIVNLYRGVNPAIDSQFSEKKGLQLPSWALIIVIMALIVAGIIVASQQGLIKL